MTTQLSHPSLLWQYNYHITVDCNGTTVTSQLITTVQLSHHSWSLRYNFHSTVGRYGTNFKSQLVATVQLSHFSLDDQNEVINKVLIPCYRYLPHENYWSFTNKQPILLIPACKWMFIFYVLILTLQVTFRLCCLCENLIFFNHIKHIEFI